MKTAHQPTRRHLHLVQHTQSQIMAADIGRQPVLGDGINKPDNDQTSSSEEGHSSSSPLSEDTNSNAQRRFKLPKAPDSMASSQSNNDCPIQPLTVTKHHSTIEMPTSRALEDKTRLPKRKTSVFSHAGFMGIHKLDQATIQQHPIVANGVAEKDDTQVDEHQLEGKSQQPQQSTSPRRSNRSDTLGSTGSSRASSCDEPTIVNPTKIFASTLAQTAQQQQLHKQKQSDLKHPTSSNLSSDSSPPVHESILSTADRPRSTTLRNTEQTKSGNEKEPQTQQVEAKASQERCPNADVEEERENDDDDIDDDDDDDDDDDEDDVVFMAQSNSSEGKLPQNLKLPPFESIKTQLKRNSIPNAQDITRHIENLISRNEEIIKVENWNQVSIRSYNTSSQSSSTVGPSNRRPSKRWSTTSMGKPPVNSERKCSHDQTNRTMQQFHVHKQQVPFDNRTNIVSQACQSFCSNYEVLPPNVSMSMPASPKQSAHLPSETNSHLHQGRFNGCDLTMDQSLHSPSTSLPFGAHRSNLSIESAIRNLSLKKHEDDQLQMHHDQINQLGPRDDIVMAAIMVERQRQQRLLEDYLGSEAHLASALEDQHFIPEELLSYLHQQQQQQQHQQHQQQQHQHLLEKQLALNRLVALKNEYQQQQQRHQMAARLMAASIQNQQQSQLSSASQQLFLQYNCLTANQAIESRLLNDYISKMVLSRDEIFKAQSKDLASSTKGTNLQHAAKSPVSPSKLYLGHSSEMLTQSLDSATPAHRCEACDISFWTRDLLNYHTMTSCSARRGPGPAKPIAFNFNQPNGFDAAPSNQGQQSMVNTPLQSPAVLISHAPDNHFSLSASQLQLDHLQSKSVSPTRRRTYNELDTPSSSLEISPQARQPKRQSTSSMYNHYQNHEIQRSPLVCNNNEEKSIASRSPHTNREPVNFTLQKKLDPSVINQHKPHVTSAGEESNLPIKKRKISEPNMRY